MAKLTAKDCRARAGCLEEAAEHLNVAWCIDDKECPPQKQIGWTYDWLMRQVDKWEVKAEKLEGRY